MVSKIILDPGLSPQCHVVKADNPRIRGCYEAGDVIVIDDFPLDIDLDFVRHMEILNPDRSVKKAKAKHLLARIKSKPWGDQYIARFCRSPKDAERFQQIIVDTQNKCQKFLDTAFRGYEWVETSSTWRLTETANESMHFDIFYKPDLFYVRLFINIDTQPRIWRTSYDIKTAWGIAGDECPPEYRNVDGGKDSLMFWLSKRIFGKDAFNERDNHRERQYPRHEYHFAPGTAWLANSHFRSHQIEFGKKMISYAVTAKRSSMRNAALSFGPLVREMMG